MYWLWGTHSLWKDTLLSLDTVGRALNLPQSNVPYPLSGLGWREWKEGREWELGLVCKMKEDSLFSFQFKKKKHVRQGGSNPHL